MADEHREFWSRIADRYDAVVELQMGPGTRSLVRERLAKEDRLGNLAEFGCGTGFYTQILADRADSVVATDLSPGMLAVAGNRITARNVTFQAEDCQRTSFAAATFDTVFMSLVIHFTEPDETLAEMHRILKPGGRLILSNLDPGALGGLDRLRSLVRVLYRGIAGYRVKPPKGFGRNVLTGSQLRTRLVTGGFAVVSMETIKDTSSSSNIPVDYVSAVKT